MLLRLGPWGTVPVGHGQADGRIISCRLCGWTRNALLNRYFPLCQENLDPCPFTRCPVTGAGDNRSPA
jgi:hypothetical protein